MPQNIRRRLFGRIVLWDPYGGTVFDLSSRRVLASGGPSQSEEYVRLASGDVDVISRQHTVEIPITERESSDILRVIKRAGCGLRGAFLGLNGTDSWMWLETTRPKVKDKSIDPGSIAPRTIELDSNVFYPAIWEGMGLLSGIPWRGTQKQVQEDGLIKLVYKNIQRPGYNGPLWDVEQDSSVDLDGEPNNIENNWSTRIEFPVWGSVIRADSDGAFSANVRFTNWKDNLIVKDFSPEDGVKVPGETWYVYLGVLETESKVDLVVDSLGQNSGVLVGSLRENCTRDPAAPKWSRLSGIYDVQSREQPSSAVHYYDFSSGSGDTVVDRVGNLDLTLKNGYSWTQYGVEFTGGGAISDSPPNIGQSPPFLITAEIDIIDWTNNQVYAFLESIDKSNFVGVLGGDRSGNDDAVKVYFDNGNRDTKLFDNTKVDFIANKPITIGLLMPFEERVYSFIDEHAIGFDPIYSWVNEQAERLRFGSPGGNGAGNFIIREATVYDLDIWNVYPFIRKFHSEDYPSYDDNFSIESESNITTTNRNGHTLSAVNLNKNAGPGLTTKEVGIRVFELCASTQLDGTFAFHVRSNSGEWETYRIDDVPKIDDSVFKRFTPGTDNHNRACIELDSENYIWTSYNQHSTELQLSRSSKPISKWGGNVENIDTFNMPDNGFYENGVTYPYFFRDNDDKLCLKYRFGGSGNGQNHYIRLKDPSADTLTWEPFYEQERIIFDGINASPNFNAYQLGDQPVVGDNGFVHKFNVYRENSGRNNYYVGYVKVHPTLGAQRADGTSVSVPITNETSIDIVDNADFRNAGFDSNQQVDLHESTGVGLDSNNNPHGAYTKPDGTSSSRNRQIYHVYWDGSSWNKTQITSNTSGMNGAFGCALLADDNDKVYIIGCEPQGGTGYYIWESTPPYNSWTKSLIVDDDKINPSQNTSQPVPKVDERRFNLDGTLSMTICPWDRKENLNFSANLPIVQYEESL